MTTSHTTGIENAPDSGRSESEPSVSGLAGAVAVVTGGARGIGAATAARLAQHGASLVLVDRLAEELASVEADLVARGADVHTVNGDVRDHEVVRCAVELAVERYGVIDVLVNNAGGGFFSPFLDISPKGEAALIAENFTQVADCIRTAVPHMTNGGSIVNITSIEAHRAGPGFSIYSAMKAAVENLTKTLALELADRRIRVNAIAPDMIPTPGDAGLIEASGAMVDTSYDPTPLGTVGDAADVADAVAFLASMQSSFITGSVLHLDGGTAAASGWRRRRDTGAWGL